MVKVSKESGTKISVRLPGPELRTIIACAVGREIGVDLSSAETRVRRVDIRTERCLDDVGDEPVAYVEIFIESESRGRA